jgi:hypothetical protein
LRENLDQNKVEGTKIRLLQAWGTKSLTLKKLSLKIHWADGDALKMYCSC